MNSSKLRHVGLWRKWHKAYCASGAELVAWNTSASVGVHQLEEVDETKSFVLHVFLHQFVRIARAQSVRAHNRTRRCSELTFPFNVPDSRDWLVTSLTHLTCAMNHALVAELEVFVVVLPVNVVDDDESLARHCHQLREKSCKNVHENFLLNCPSKVIGQV